MVMSESREQPDREVLAEEFLGAFRERRPPALRQGDRKILPEALDALIVRGHLETVEHVVPYLRDAFPRSEYLDNLGAVLDRMPPSQGQPRFEDDPAKDMQVVRRRDAEAVVFLFCGHAQRLGLPLTTIHHWLGLMPASLVYLRDFHRLFYLAGIRSLGTSRSDAIAALRDIANSLGARRVACYGNSGGAFAALLYGLELGAQAVLALSGVVNLSRDFNRHLRQTVNLTRLWKELPNDPVDLRRLFAAAELPPRARLVYAEYNWDDRLHAEYLVGLPTVSLRVVERHDGHNTVMELIKRRELDAELGWLLR